MHSQCHAVPRTFFRLLGKIARCTLIFFTIQPDSLDTREGMMMRTNGEQSINDAKSRLNLVGARIEKGVTLEEIEQSTRIATHFLEAIEAENFGQLPGGVYNTSYIRQYARAIGYDETALLDHYRSQVEPPKEAEAATASSFRVDEALRSVFQFVTARRRHYTA